MDEHHGQAPPRDATGQQQQLRHQPYHMNIHEAANGLAGAAPNHHGPSNPHRWASTINQYARTAHVGAPTPIGYPQPRQPIMGRPNVRSGDQASPLQQNSARSSAQIPSQMFQYNISVLRKGSNFADESQNTYLAPQILNSRPKYHYDAYQNPQSNMARPHAIAYQQHQPPTPLPESQLSIYTQLREAAEQIPNHDSLEQQYPDFADQVKAIPLPTFQLTLPTSPGEYNSLAAFTEQDKTQTRANHIREVNYVVPRTETTQSRLITDLLLAGHPPPPHRGVPCSQDLLPGMHVHWGQSRLCEGHAPNHVGVQDFVVCKGCTVTHYALADAGFERGIVMARGARVDVCRKCAERAVHKYGVGYRGCECATRWLCFQCREEECHVLARKRTRAKPGRCGRCLARGELVAWVEYCVRCWKWRVHGDGRQETKREEHDVM